MLKIGLTGGIGSGKSTVASIFEVLGVPVYYADNAARRLMNDDEHVRMAIRETFGDEAYSNGSLDRKYLAGIVFNDPDKLKQLNAIVHPATLADATVWMNEQHTPYVIKEAALIFESGSDTALNYIIGVQAPESLRVTRTMHRDKISKQEVLTRMKMQMNEDQKMRLCNFLLINDEDNPVIPQVLNLHEELIKLAVHIPYIIDRLE